MTREWQIARTNRSKIIPIARALNIPPIVVQILMARGIDSLEGVKRFLNPAVEHIGDPFLLPDMEVACDRVTKAIRDREKILIYGDYDVDGVSGTALLYRALKRMGAENCTYDVPHRLHDGFGLSAVRVEQAKRENVSLIITVDNGSSAHDAANKAQEVGIDLIITDHHQPDQHLPCAMAIVNVARETGDHPSSQACGVAVAYKLAWALTNEVHDLDLVALGTIADVVPLVGENRDFVATGLEWVCRLPRPGLAALARKAGLTLERLKAEDVAYYLAPRLNAAGRLDSAHLALDLLLTESEQDALRLADLLEQANQERKRLEIATFEEALRVLENQLTSASKSIVLCSDEWHPGVVGIVAARLQSHYALPTILVVFGEDGIGRGSARSVEGLNIAEVLSECQEYLVSYGGHKAAAGVTLHRDNFERFRDRFEEVVGRMTAPGEMRAAPLAIDAVVSLTELDGRLMRALDQLAPFGHGNPSPCFLSQRVRVLPNSLREVKGEHLKFAVQEGPRILPAIAFRMYTRYSELQRASAVDLVYSPQLEHWQGEATIQLRVKDFRVVA